MNHEMITHVPVTQDKEDITVYQVPVEIIDHVPGFSPSSLVETAQSEVVSDGEYHGGDIDRIAARSGVDPDEVAVAALVSIQRQKHDV